MQWIKVLYPFTRDVYVDGELCGRTNHVMAVGSGTQRIDLGSPVDYAPPRRIVTVTGTSQARPREIVFSAT